MSDVAADRVNGASTATSGPKRAVDAPLRPPWSQQGLLEVFQHRYILTLLMRREIEGTPVEEEGRARASRSDSRHSNGGTPMVSLLARSLVAASLLAIPAAGHDGCDLFAARFAFPQARIGFEMPVGSVEFGVARPIHRHEFRREVRRVWVEPVFETRVVAFDLCGRPILRQCLVRPGYWSTRVVEVCRCGAARSW